MDIFDKYPCGAIICRNALIAEIFITIFRLLNVDYNYIDKKMNMMKTSF
jgi:hypothetical protein